eukprot:m51a1_g7873 hypothetical protein (203) ;mRNA; r:16665-17820
MEFAAELREMAAEEWAYRVRRSISRTSNRCLTELHMPPAIHSSLRMEGIRALVVPAPATRAIGDPQIGMPIPEETPKRRRRADSTPGLMPSPSTSPQPSRMNSVTSAERAAKLPLVLAGESGNRTEYSVVASNGLVHMYTMAGRAYWLAQSDQGHATPDWKLHVAVAREDLPAAWDAAARVFARTACQSSMKGAPAVHPAII